MIEGQSRSTQERVATGIAGLDEILDGGFPANHLYLVEGDPGTGKTTLALQFLLEGRARGESGLYVTLSETADELYAVAVSHGWSLDGIALFELESLEERLRAEDQYTVFNPAEVELNETIKRICEEVEKRGAVRVVFDSLSEMRLLARDPLRYRRQVLSLKQYFVGRKCTVLLLDDRTADQTDLQLQSICHGVITLNRVAVEYGGARRRLQVAKLRGLKFQEGFHDVTIESGGLIVYPRLVASATRSHAAPGGRAIAQSGIPKLDEMLGGGIHYGTSTLAIGPAGCGKSTLVTQYAHALCAQGEKIGCYLFEETRANFLERALGLGMNLTPAIEEGRVSVEQIDPAELSPGEFADKIRLAVENRGVRVIVIDSLNGYLNAMPSESFLLIHLHELLTYLNDRGVLTLLVLAQHGLVGVAMQSPIDVTYLADSVLMLRYFEAFGEVRQAIAVVKKRTGSHERSIRQFQISAAGLQIGDPLVGFEGIMTGVPVYRGGREKLLPESEA
jgi:circadian clock protein KaiC